MFEPFAAGAFWSPLSRLGEAQILLPAMLVSALWLAFRPRGLRPALIWLLATGLAASITTASKIAFLGFGIGSAAWDFTGISGHAMFAAAVLPPLLLLASGPLGGKGRRWLLLAAYALAAAVAVSRVMVDAHSWSEVVSGMALGSAASAVALSRRRWPALRLARWAPLLMLGWALLAVAGAPPSRTHDMVTRLSLALADRPHPYRRAQLHSEHRRKAAACASSGLLC